MDLNDLKLRVRSIPDWPQKGVIFRDITPVLENKKPIKIVKIKFVLARDRKPISSTRILKGEIDRQAPK